MRGGPRRLACLARAPAWPSRRRSRPRRARRAAGRSRSRGSSTAPRPSQGEYPAQGGCCSTSTRPGHGVRLRRHAGQQPPLPHRRALRDRQTTTTPLAAEQLQRHARRGRPQPARRREPRTSSLATRGPPGLRRATRSPERRRAAHAQRAGRRPRARCALVEPGERGRCGRRARSRRSSAGADHPATRPRTRSSCSRPTSPMRQRRRLRDADAYGTRLRRRDDGVRRRRARRDTCQGDSGGPLMVSDGAVPRPRRRRLVGHRLRRPAASRASTPASASRALNAWVRDRVPMARATSRRTPRSPAQPVTLLSTATHPERPERLHRLHVGLRRGRQFDDATGASLVARLPAAGERVDRASTAPSPAATTPRWPRSAFNVAAPPAPPPPDRRSTPPPRDRAARRGRPRAGVAHDPRARAARRCAQRAASTSGQLRRRRARRARRSSRSFRGKGRRSAPRKTKRRAAAARKRVTRQADQGRPEAAAQEGASSSR